ncbi:hypothetical protein POTOM_000929 [Populus tomentosa]|uniref:C4-dicarboxylate transporter/malic acid transport protein n=1 Tax=Populus tomentosa TaxID=118781 RepID=A0A8X8DH24_POPTO|nr:hypothetical protein POTOM_000929 [Populus tomentosa]
MRGGFFQEVDVVLVDLIRLVGLMRKQGKGILESSRLNQLSDYEDILLPRDKKWPFLLRFPIGCFAVKREYFHPVRVNFFFAPWVVCMFLAISVPPLLAPEDLHPARWCAFMGPYFFLELKIYGQWLSCGKRSLCKVANPSSHLSVVANFVGAILASKVGWKEASKFLWAVGFAHYLVVFVTLHQRLPTSEPLAKELHPVSSMFIAAPSPASIAWETIYGDFYGLSRTFSVAWWSYTFPMTTASVTTIKYAENDPGVLSRGLALTLLSTVFCIFH